MMSKSEVVEHTAHTIVDERMNEQERNAYIKTMFQLSMIEGYMLVDFEDDVEQEIKSYMGEV